MEIYLTLLTTLVFTYYTAKIDAEHYAEKQWVKNHNSRWIQRAVFVAVIAVTNWPMALSMGLLFWVLFDQTLNFMRNKKLLYFGSKSKLDLLFNNNKSFYVSLKFVALFSVILILIYATPNY